MYETQLQNNMARLTSLLYELYGKRWDFYKVLNELEKLMHKAYEERKVSARPKSSKKKTIRNVHKKK